MMKIEANSKIPYRDILKIALPVTAQAVLQASFALVDQVLVGGLGDLATASVGIAVRIIGLHATMLGSVAVCASVMFAQYAGARDVRGFRRAVQVSLSFVAVLYALLALPALLLPETLIGLFSTDQRIMADASGYLRVVILGNLPMALTMIASARLRVTERASLPMWAGLATVTIDALLSYLLIYGKLNLPRMGVYGAGLATAIANVAGLILLLVLSVAKRKQGWWNQKPSHNLNGSETTSLALIKYFRQGLHILVPALAGELVWGAGEAMYGVVYGRMGVHETAAVAATGPVQYMAFALFTGFMTATGVLVGERLGRSEHDQAYSLSAKLMKTGLLISLGVGALIVLLSPLYRLVFNFTDITSGYMTNVLRMYGLVLCAKIYNYVLSCGVLPAGGETKYGFLLNLIGPWGMGVPAGFIAAFVLHWPVHWVFFMVNMEEVLRAVLGTRMFIKRGWMKTLTGEGGHGASTENT